MPMKLNRAINYVKEGKAKWRTDNKLGMRYLVLLQKPDTYNTQDVVLGFDPGSCYDGLTVLTKMFHAINVELVHNKEIKKQSESRRMYRRNRRGRLRNRKCKNNSRTKPKLTQTIRSMFNFRKWMIEKLLKYFPINLMVFEFVSYSKQNKKGQKSFAHVMQGQRIFLAWIKSKLIEIFKTSGYITKPCRIKLFGKKDLKLKKKDAKDFYAHCVDSTTLAAMQIPEYSLIHLNTKTRIIEKVFYERRKLHKTKNKIGDKCLLRKPIKGGKLVPIEPKPLGNINFCYVQVKANNFKDFQFINNGRVVKTHKFITKYGGTKRYGISKTMLLNFDGEIIKPKNTGTFEKLAKRKKIYDDLAKLNKCKPTIVCFQNQSLEYC
jgi:hypothetical protein